MLVSPGPIRVLVADDQELVRSGLAMILDAQPGIEVVGQAADGRQAVEMARRLRPDVCLLDVRMPGLDGFTVCRLLKANEETRLIPIVIMTALNAAADRITGIQAGADDFLTKPVHEEELVARIATALTLKHTVDRRLGELRALKEHVAQFVRLVTPPDAPAS